MSRSRKYPIYKDGSHPWAKKEANKRVRQYIKLLDKGFKSIGFFHKLFCSYDICDYKFNPSTEEDIIKASRK